MRVFELPSPRIKPNETLTGLSAQLHHVVVCGNDHLIGSNRMRNYLCVSRVLARLIVFRMADVRRSITEQPQCLGHARTEVLVPHQPDLRRPRLSPPIRHAARPTPSSNRCSNLSAASTSSMLSPYSSATSSIESSSSSA